MQRLRLLAADLFVFDRHRLAWRLAVRTLLALMVPLFAFLVLGQPMLVYVGLGGFLVAIGDSVDDGDRQQFLRLLVGALVGGLAVACGALASASLPLALLGTVAWCLLAGLLGVWGNAFAAMGLPLAWAFVEIGLPSGQHEPKRALLLGALWAAGGALVLVLTPLVRLGGANAALGEQVGACWRALADYLESLNRPVGAVSAGVVPPETEVRANIAEARRLAAGRRASNADRELALIESADRLFKTAALLSDSDATERSDLSELAKSARALAAALHKRPSPARSAPAERSPVLAPGEGVAARLARELAHAWRLLDGEPAPSPSDGPHAPPAAGPVAAVLGPLGAALDPQSVVARHALRFALVTAAAVVVFWYFPPPFGYWVPLTVTVVLKPYAGITVSRTLQRLLGTVLGAALGTALMPLLPGLAAQFTAAAVAFFCLMLVLRFNYSLAVFFLSLGVVPFEHVVIPGLSLDVGLWRLLATAIGAVLALVGGHLLWPDFERRELPGLLQRSVRSAARYAATAIDGAGLAEARQEAGLDTTNFHTTAQRALSEVGLAARDKDTLLIAVTALQRLMLAINAVADSALQSSETASAQALFLSLAQGEVDAAEAARRLREQADACADRRLERLAAPLETLAGCAKAWS
jgi:uncharacterized membrane protein YccC